MINALLQKMKPKRSLYMQLSFTAFAFFLMVIFSYLFINGILRDNLLRNTENILELVGANVKSDLREQRNTLDNFGQTVRGMILRGDGAKELREYTASLSEYVSSKEGGAVSGLYGFIENHPKEGSFFMNGLRTPEPDGYSPADRPWYKAAREANGAIAESPPYNDMVTGETIVTFSRGIYDDNGGFLGVTGIDLQTKNIGDEVVNTTLTKGGFGFLTDHDLTIIAHANPDFVGHKLNDPTVPLSQLLKRDEFREHGTVTGVPLLNWRGEKTVCFIATLPNGWVFGLLAQKAPYYQSSTYMAVILSILGAVLAAILMIVLVRVDTSKNLSDTQNRHKSVFLANMSHEIRTPMNAIIGMTLVGKTSPDKERKDYCFSKIEDASNHLLGVINDILDMSKIEANKFELSPEEFDFEKMLQRVVNVINYRVDEKRQKFSVHIDRSIPETIIADDQRLAQVITNLLGNAVKFTPEEGSITLTASLAGEENGECTLQISVTDTGIGITPVQLSKLFHSFEQAESGTTRKYGGTGLGLAISKSIVEMMGGKVSVKSEPAKGSTFTFTIQAKRGAKKKQVRLDPDIDWSNVRVMAVDDDRHILEYFLKIMSEFGINCDAAKSGEEALSLVNRNGNYHIYFVDWKMPVMDGMELARELKARASAGTNSIVIMISSAEWSAIAENAKKAGVDKFLSKPLFPSNILEIITECLNSDSLKKKNAPEDVKDNFAGRRILLVEDVEINREIVQIMLEPTKVAIDCAENGQQAVEMFSKQPDKYDIIFMDVQMPVMDGYEATTLIRQMDFPKAKTIPIIAMTANVFKEDIEKCLNVGMNSHIGKPLDFNDVSDELNYYLSPRMA